MLDKDFSNFFFAELGSGEAEDVLFKEVGFLSLKLLIDTMETFNSSEVAIAAVFMLVIVVVGKGSYLVPLASPEQYFLPIFCVGCICREM